MTVLKNNSANIVKVNDRLFIIPVIHTDPESTNNVEKTILKLKPQVVAVELCRERYEELVKAKENGFPVQKVDGRDDLPSQMFAQIASLESFLGAAMGSPPGDEMLIAIDAARKVGATIALVDRSIQAITQAFSQIPMYELQELISLFPQELDSQESEDGIELSELVKDLRDPEKVKDLLNEFKEKFPHVFDALVTQRDEHVAKNLHKIMEDFDGLIVVVLGSGHVSGVIEKFKEMEKTL